MAALRSVSASRFRSSAASRDCSASAARSSASRVSPLFSSDPAGAWSRPLVSPSPRRPSALGVLELRANRRVLLDRQPVHLLDELPAAFREPVVADGRPVQLRLLLRGQLVRAVCRRDGLAELLAFSIWRLSSLRTAGLAANFARAAPRFQPFEQGHQGLLDLLLPLLGPAERRGRGLLGLRRSASRGEVGFERFEFLVGQPASSAGGVVQPVGRRRPRQVVVLRRLPQLVQLGPQPVLRVVDPRRESAAGSARPVPAGPGPPAGGCRCCALVESPPGPSSGPRAGGRAGGAVRRECRPGPAARPPPGPAWRQRSTRPRGCGPATLKPGHVVEVVGHNLDRDDVPFLERRPVGVTESRQGKSFLEAELLRSQSERVVRRKGNSPAHEHCGRGKRIGDEASVEPGDGSRRSAAIRSVLEPHRPDGVLLVLDRALQT